MTREEALAKAELIRRKKAKSQLRYMLVGAYLAGVGAGTLGIGGGMIINPI